MIKEIVKAFFGSIGNTFISFLIFFSFYVSPGWFSFTSKEADSRGWGSIFYSGIFFPLVVIVVFLNAVNILKGTHVPYKGLLLGFYALIMIGIGSMNFVFIDKLKIAGSLAVAAFIVNILFIACLHLLKTKYS